MENKRIKPDIKKSTSKTNTKPKAIENMPVNKNNNLVKVVLFFIIILISYMVFASNFFSIKELSNPFMKAKVAWLMNIQFMLYTVVYIVFGFFAYGYISGKPFTKIRHLTTIVGFILVVIIHYLAFNKAFEDVDDNASYMIAAKSLVDKGASYYLYMPEMKPDTEGAIGLPLMLIPLYLQWGMNYVPMEILIFLLMIGSVILSYFVFKKMEGVYFGLLMALLYGLHPYIVSFSSIIMTEIPYIFWTLLGLFLCLKFEEKHKINWWLLIAGSVAVFMTYLTRAIGIGFVLAVIMYFFLKSKIFLNLKEKKIPFYKDLAFLKFITISTVLFVFVLLYQLWTRSLGGPSQAEALAKMSLMDQFMKNTGLVWDVLSQNIFAGKLARFEVNQKYLEAVNYLWAGIFLITLIGVIYSILKKQLIGISFILVLLVLLVGNVATQQIVVSRYLIVFTPFLIYFVFLGIKAIMTLIDKREIWVKPISLILLCFLLGNSFLGDAFNIQRSTKETLYAPPYKAFLDCAVWAKDNLTKDAIVASRKERIFYIFSDGLRGYKHVPSNEISRLQEKLEKASSSEEQSKIMNEWEQSKLDQIKQNDTDYIIIDTFSATRQLMGPIIDKNPKKFKLEKTIGDEKTGPCYVFKVIKWWS